MDPYLESPQHWPLFQHGLIAGLTEVLQPSLGDRYRLRSAFRTYVNEQVLFTSIIRENHKEEYLEIRQRSSDRLVTHIDVVSPANRSTSKGRAEYKARREEVKKLGANLVEIELVLQGQSCLDIAAEGLPEFDYAVSVCRSRQQDRYEIYTTAVQKRLPRIRLPLASDDRDLIIDTQAVFSRCYDRLFAGKVDYTKDPPTLLREADMKWLRQLLTPPKPAPRSSGNP
jgi:hypothetical protein